MKRKRRGAEDLSGAVVAIVGRPNVGKSTLFNRIVGGSVAVVGAEEGITRDRHYAGTEWAGTSFVLVDTGGLLPGKAGEMEELVREQVLAAVEEADLLLFVVDAGPGPTETDLQAARLIRRSGRPVLLVANKVDHEGREGELYDFLSLGLGEAIPVSAMRGRLVGDLLDAVVGRISVPEEGGGATGATRIAMIGRPNVGKSSLVNAIVGKPRVLVHETPGTTRDAVDTLVELGEERFILVDTAGLRRATRRQPGVEYWSALRSERSLAASDVALLVLEGPVGVTRQDARIAGLIDERGRGAVIVVNKWDLVPEDEKDSEAVTRYLRRKLPFLHYAPAVFVSALTGEGTEEPLKVAAEVQRERTHRVATSDLNRWLESAAAHRPPSHRGKRGRLLYATQVGIGPPRFLLFVNDPELFTANYLRYLGNRLRQEAPFVGTAVRFTLRARREPGRGTPRRK